MAHGFIYCFFRLLWEDPASALLFFEALTTPEIASFAPLLFWARLLRSFLSSAQKEYGSGAPATFRSPPVPFLFLYLSEECTREVNLALLRFDCEDLLDTPPCDCDTVGAARLLVRCDALVCREASWFVGWSTSTFATGMARHRMLDRGEGYYSVCNTSVRYLTDGGRGRRLCPD